MAGTGVDPLSLAASATQFGIGALQSVFGRRSAKKAERQLEDLKTPTYNGSKSINDYYTTALNRASVTPFESAAYKLQEQNSGRNFNAGLTFLNSKRSGLAGIGGLVTGQNDALLRAGVSATADSNQRFSQLGNATGMKNSDDRFAFDQNQIAPFQKNLQLLALKARAGNDKASAGISNVFGGLNSAAMIGSGGGTGAPSARVSTNARMSEWDKIMNEYRGRTGSSWNPASALNDAKIIGGKLYNG